jgi:hypothetical protein
MEAIVIVVSVLTAAVYLGRRAFRAAGGRSAGPSASPGCGRCGGCSGQAAAEPLVQLGRRASAGQRDRD